MASNLVACCYCSDGLHPNSDGLHPNSNGLQPSCIRGNVFFFQFSPPCVSLRDTLRNHPPIPTALLPPGGSTPCRRTTGCLEASGRWVRAPDGAGCVSYGCGSLSESWGGSSARWAKDVVRLCHVFGPVIIKSIRKHTHRPVPSP